MGEPLPTIQEIQPSKIFCNAIVEERPQGVNHVNGAGIWLLDENMRVVWMNDVMEKIYGPLDLARGQNCFKAFRGRNDRCPDCLPTQAFETGNIVSGYVSRTTKDGVQRFYQLVEAPLMNNQNKVMNVLEIVLDVTEKARMEQTVRDSEKEYRALFENAGTAVAVCDRDGILVRVNHAFEELSGYKKSELEKRMHYLKLVHPKDHVRLEQITIHRSLNPETVPNSYEFTFLRKDNEERTIHITVNALSDGNQIVSLLDITEKLRLEQEIRNKEQFLANILRHSMEAIAAMDVKGYIRSWNQGAELAFGYKAKDILGKSFTTLFTPEFRRSKKLDQASKKFVEQGFLKNFIADAVTKDGRSIVIDITRTVIRGGDGSVQGSSVIIRDITESRRQEQRMIQQEKMSAMGELAASLAHEIKNPLNSMVINMEVLKGHFADLKEDKKAAVSKYVDILASETGRLDNVMKKFLDFARPIEGRFDRIDLAKVVFQIVQLFSAQAEKERVKIKTNFEKNLPLIDGAEDYLKQIFVNLILNAMQAMKKGGQIKIGLHRGKNNAVMATVEDNGIGIPRQNYGKIFDLYFSTKEKGSGLGLPLVKRLVTAHSGHIVFESKVKHGTKFIITLPSG